MSGARYQGGDMALQNSSLHESDSVSLDLQGDIRQVLQIKTMVLLMSYELLHVKTSCRKRREDLKQWMRPRIESSSTTTEDIA